MTANRRAPLGIAVRDLDVAIDGRAIVSGATVLAPAGTVTAVIGPNGSGKSTLLRAVYRACRPSSGTVHIGGQDVWQTRARDNARARAVVTQHQGESADFTCREIVDMGRSPYKGLLSGESADDRLIVAESLERVGMAAFADRHFQNLSGGERQRVLLARALAQRAPAILLDEPTNHLDVESQIALLGMIGDLDATILLALHDLNQALAHADHVVVMGAGRVVAAGPAESTVTPGLLAEVFRVDARIVADPFTGGPHLVFASIGNRWGSPSDH
ncbi:ABC transporter ATP-binding protein [Gordonia spumicola]|uniref:ABC transporter ATP-binding protein n=1 Tax=Gordonia spumicola TaxID=589161 RepID=A0A7I9V5Y1_9ACTN|nr:ABC transporter ATP-binding protein [Gordonia spumicola]GEE00602.1 ABC transporter ATP-binding protein [Gordonia spumicola]